MQDLITRQGEARRRLGLERQCAVDELERLASAWILPYPKEEAAQAGALIRDPEVEAIAMREAMAYEQARGWLPEDVSNDDLGFDIRSRDPGTGNVRFIEVKGHGDVAPTILTRNEYETAKRLGMDYWLYVVYHCHSKPELAEHRDPGRLGWEPIVKIEQYRLDARALRADDAHPRERV